jgi:hypothetical protein
MRSIIITLFATLSVVGCAPTEHALIASTGAEGVVLLSGHVHFSEASMTDEGRIHSMTSRPAA